MLVLVVFVSTIIAHFKECTPLLTISVCVFSRFAFRLDKAKKFPCPVNVTFAKGALHVAVTRKFVHWVFNDKSAIEFREWVKDTVIPDETFFSSLNVSPQIGVPGAYTGM